MIVASRIRRKLGAVKRKIKRRMELGRILSAMPKQERKVIVIATPTHGNLGDQAIVYAEKLMLGETYACRVFEIPNELYLCFPNLIEKHISQEDTIVIDGGGNLGTLWDYEDDKITDIIARFRENKIIVFPQTCYYDDTDAAKAKSEHNQRVYAAAKRLRVMLRDEESYRVFTARFPETHAYYVPDVVLSLCPEIESSERKGALVCFREDREKVDGSDEMKKRLREALSARGLSQKETSTLVNRGVGSQTREQELKEKFSEFATAEIVVTDRLHAMLFCAITGTSCVAVDNISRKVSGSYKWIEELSYIEVIDSVDEIESAVTKVLKSKGSAQRFEYPKKMVVSIINEEYT